MAAISVAYGTFYIHRDYRKKGPTPIKNLNPGQKCSIEGEVRLLEKDKGLFERVYHKQILYTLAKSTIDIAEK